MHGFNVRSGLVLWLLALAIVLGGLAPLVPTAVADEAGTPTELPAQPTEVPAQPTEVPVVPTDVPVEPTAVPVEPTEAPVEPTEAPVEPTEEPTEVPVDPTEAPPQPTEQPQSSQRIGIQSVVELTGTITKTPSNPNPVPGEIVTFTITASGTAPGGTVLSIDDNYELAPITYLSSSIGTLSNATASGTIQVAEDINIGTLGVNFDFTVPADGAYSATITVQIQVKATTAVGETIDTGASLEGNSGSLDTALANLTVSGGSTPLTGEITKVASNANPIPGETVTFTITASGTAPAGTRLVIIDLYELAPITYSTNSIGTLANATADAPIAVTEIPTADRLAVTFNFTVPESGAYSATITVQLQVKNTTADGETIAANAEVREVGTLGVPLDSVSANLTVNVPTPLTGTITKTPSNANPVPGETVTFTITASGTAPAGTALRIEDIYELPPITYQSSSIGTLTNATAIGAIQVAELIGSGELTVNFDFTVPDSGAYSATITVQIQVKPTTDVGETIEAGAYLLAAEALDLVLTPLTVTAAPTPPTVTKTASNPNPRPDDPLTYTVTVSGEAAAGTAYTVTDVLPGEVSLDALTTASSTNVSEPVLTPGETATATFTVPATGEFSIAFEIVTTVDDGLRPGTEISNTVCVDIELGPQDTCATSEVETATLSSLIRLLIALLLALLGPVAQ